jgi:hypothetical protein
MVVAIDNYPPVTTHSMNMVTLPVFLVSDDSFVGKLGRRRRAPPNPDGEADEATDESTDREGRLILNYLKKVRRKCLNSKRHSSFAQAHHKRAQDVGEFS